MSVKILFMLILSFSAAVAYGQPTTTTPTTMPPAQNIPGGYNDVPLTDKDVQTAARFAVEQMQQGTLVKIVSAQMQVVAGKNYSIQLILNQNGVNNQFNVTVFMPLPSSGQTMQLTNVEAMGQVVDTSTDTSKSTDNTTSSDNTNNSTY